MGQDSEDNCWSKLQDMSKFNPNPLTLIDYNGLNFILILRPCNEATPLFRLVSQLPTDLYMIGENPLMWGVKLTTCMERDPTHARVRTHTFHE